MATYTIKSGDTLSGIAKANNLDVNSLLKSNPSITDPNKIYAGQNLNLPNQQSQQSSANLVNVSPDVYKQVQDVTSAANKVLGTNTITTPIDINSVKPTGTQTPTLPTPQAPSVNSTFVNSLSTDLNNSRTALEAAYKNQIDTLNSQMADSQKKIDTLTASQANNLANIQTVTEPFRKQLEDTQRQQLYVNENFQANQTLVNELDGLLTQGNDLIKQQQDATGLASIRNPRIAQTISDVNARAGVIQAVINARNGQISQAYTMIDRSISAITADRQDQLNYYNALNSFYENQKTVEGNKLITLSNDQKTFMNAQISLLQNDLQNAQKNADYIKGLMTNPQTAMDIAQAGVTLNDTPEQINQKLATYEVQKTTNDTINQMASNGYSYLATSAQQSAHPANEIVTMKDANGNDLKFWKVPTKTQTTEGVDQATIDYYASQIESGGLFLSDVPSNVRNEVAAKLGQPKAVDFSGTKFNGLTATFADGSSMTFPSQDALNQFKKDNNIADQAQNGTQAPAQPTGNEVYGTGKFANVPLTDRLKYYQDLNLKNGFPENTGVRESLIQNGYPADQVDKLMHPVLSFFGML